MKTTIVQVDPKSRSFPADILGKWYGCYHEVQGGESYSRYVHPNGWQTCAWYFNTKEEVETAIAKHPPAGDMPVSPTEVQTRQMMKEDVEMGFDPGFTN